LLSNQRTDGSLWYSFTNERLLIKIGWITLLWCKQQVFFKPAITIVKASKSLQ
jgi:hypothetical protein